MGAPHISWSPKMHLRFNNFRVWHLFVACLYFSSASLLLYIFHYASVPHFYMCCSFSSSPSPAMFLWVQRLLRSALFVKLRITFYYSSWVNIKFNMMHQINVCSVFCFFLFWALKTTWRWFLFFFAFWRFMFSAAADPDGEVHELIFMLLHSRPQFFQRKIEIIISQTLQQKKTSSNASEKFFLLLGVESSLLVCFEKRARGCVSKCLEN